MSLSARSAGARALLGLAAASFVFASTAQAQQYCQKRWSPSRGDYLDCDPYPSPSPGSCRWTWSAERGNYRVCGQYPGE